MKSKKGWIKIVEAFVALLLIVGVILIVINKGYVGGSDISEKVYEIQKTILRSIELDNELRQEILDQSISSGGGITLRDSVAPKTHEKIQTFFQDYPYLECSAKICLLEEICVLETYTEKNVYANAVAISATSSTFDPRQLKIFCWEK